MGKSLAVLPQHCCPILISDGVNDGMKPSIPLTSQIPAAKHGVPSIKGRSRHTSHKCPISANSITSQVVTNQILIVKNHKSAPLVASEVSDLWRVLTPAAVYPLQVSVSLVISP